MPPRHRKAFITGRLLRVAHAVAGWSQAALGQQKLTGGVRSQGDRRHENQRRIAIGLSLIDPKQTQRAHRDGFVELI